MVRGLPGPSGELPVIHGEDAVTRQQLDYWNESRRVIKIGGSSVPAGAGAHIRIESLEIRGAHPDYQFTDASGYSRTYSNNAAAIFVEDGDHVVISPLSLQS